MGDTLADLDGTLLQFFRLSDYSFVRSVEVLQKADIYCARMHAVSPNVIAIFGVTHCVLFRVDEFKIVQDIDIDNIIEKSNACNGYAYTLSTD